MKRSLPVDSTNSSTNSISNNAKPNDKTKNSDHSHGYFYRPVFDKIISLELTKAIFYEYCKSQFVDESFDCLMQVTEFLNFLKASERTNGNSDDGDTFDSFTKKLQLIVSTFILENAPKQTNIDFYIKSEISKLYTKFKGNYFNISNNLDSQQPLDANEQEEAKGEKEIVPYLDQWMKLFKNVELQLLLLLKTDVFPRFIRDDRWVKFVNENKSRANEWAFEEDLNELEEIKYKRKHFEYPFFSDHDLKFIDWVTEDQSCFQFVSKDETSNLAVFFSPGKEFVDEKDVNYGNFGCLKVVGYLPFPAELMVNTFTCPKFNRLLFDNMVIEDPPAFLGADMNHSIREDGVKQYPYRIGRAHFKYGMLNMRSTVSVASTFYYKGKYCCLMRGILNDDIDHCYHKNGKKVKKTTRMCSASIVSFAPISPTKCHYIQTTLVNPGGFLAKLSGLLTKKMASGWGKDLSNKIEVMKIMIEEDLEGLENGYKTTVENIMAFSKASGEKVDENIFPDSFEEYKARYSYLKDHLPKVTELLERMELTMKNRKKKGWAGASGDDSCIIAYDSILCAGPNNYETMMLNSALHGGDSDSTGTIAAAWLGRCTVGWNNVYESNWLKIEKKEEMLNIAKDIRNLFIK
ncbi:hypothetical protein ABK040_011359 [Willaertia magna]